MFEPPNSTEWCVVYAPLATLLAVCCVVESWTNRIPNQFAYIPVCYFLAARAVIGPLPFGWYLLSVLIAAILAIGVGFAGGYLGGGAAKLCIAASAGLPPSQTIGVAAVLIITTLVLAWTARWHRWERIPGTVALAAAIALVVTAAAVRELMK